MTTSIPRRAIVAAMFAAAAAACARPGAVAPVPTPTPTPVPVERAPLPPANSAIPAVPHVAGPLAIKVVYPTPGQLIQSKDSNFIFGSVGNGDAALTINGVPTPVWPNGSFMGWLPVPSPEQSRYDLVATIGVDTMRLSHPVKIQPLTPPGPVVPADTIQRLTPAQYAALIGPATVSNDTDRVVTAYSPAGGIQRWFLIPGTLVKVVSLKGPDAFVQLDSSQTVRIVKTDLNMTPAIAPVARAAGAFHVIPGSEYTDIVVPINDRPPYLVEETPTSLTVTLYSTGGTTQPTEALENSNYVSTVTSAPFGQDMRYTIALRGPVYGYQPLWQDSAFTLRVRRPPAIDATDPLKGLTIAVDPGHPPVGATGPTGLWEPVPTLAVGMIVRDLLQARGVNVLMTRTTPDPVDLNLRPTMARRANANALVSIHLNALPDGMNPFTNQGTTTYHYWMHSQPLAAATHAALLTQLSLPDRGVKRENLALVRPTWMPAILCEGAFIMMPDQEAAMRTPEYQTRYARGIVEGLEQYFRSLGQATH